MIASGCISNSTAAAVGTIGLGKLSRREVLNRNCRDVGHVSTSDKRNARLNDRSVARISNTKFEAVVFQLAPFDLVYFPSSVTISHRLENDFIK